MLAFSSSLTGSAPGMASKTEDVANALKTQNLKAKRIVESFQSQIKIKIYKYSFYCIFIRDKIYIY